MNNMKNKQYFAVALALLALLVAVTAICMGCASDGRGDDGPLEVTTEGAPSLDGSNGTQAEEPTQSESQGEADRDPTDESLSEDLSKDPSDGEVSDPADTEDESKALTVSPTYEEYCAMSSAEQQAFFAGFDDVEKFFLWFEAAKADYEERHPGVEIGPDGIIPPEG